MTRTRHRTEAALLRDERCEALAVLLARVDRGVLSRAEAAALRSLIEAEQHDADTARRSAGGQQAAVRRLQQRVAAAEQAIVETEADRDLAQAEAAQLRQQLGLAGGIRMCTARRTGRPCAAKATRLADHPAPEQTA
jgi:hypothetical protein